MSYPEPSEADNFFDCSKVWGVEKNPLSRHLFESMILGTSVSAGGICDVMLVSWRVQSLFIFFSERNIIARPQLRLPKL